MGSRYMKKIDLNTFIAKATDELRVFEERQEILSTDSRKTMEEWINNFLIFSGYQDEDEESLSSEEYDDDFYYGDSFEYQELVNRRKYRSFRDDDSY